MNRYSLNIIMLLLISLSSSLSVAADEVVVEPAEALVELELAEMPTEAELAVLAKQKEEAENKAYDSILSASVDRSWGLLLGDELTVKVDTNRLTVPINTSSLPATDKRYGTWLYLKNIDVSEDQLAFRYQLVNVPSKNVTVETPAFDVKQDNEKWLQIPPVSLTIGPALAASDGLNNIKIKGDSLPTLISTTEIQSNLKLFSIIAAVSWLILALWHFGWKTKNRQPFAQAVHDLSRLKWHRSVTPDEAARLLHTAFNDTTGTIVVYGKLDDLFQQCRWLEPLQDEIKLFYTQSEQHFFARTAGEEPNIDDVRKLAKACRAKEMLA